jgi:hypothetical protein
LQDIEVKNKNTMAPYAFIQFTKFVYLIFLI